jgi:hypothetical protein
MLRTQFFHLFLLIQLLLLPALCLARPQPESFVPMAMNGGGGVNAGWMQPLE